MKKIINGVTYNTENAVKLFYITKHPIVDGVTIPDIDVRYALYRKRPRGTGVQTNDYYEYKESDYFLHQSSFNKTMNTCEETISRVSYAEILKLYEELAEKLGEDVNDYYMYRYIQSEMEEETYC